MELNKLLEALDTRVLSGDIMGAFDQFFADDAKTYTGSHDITETKAQKAEALRWFFAGISKINRIERPAFLIKGEDITESQFVFDFTGKAGNPLIFKEIIRRTWKNGKVVEEQYLLNHTLSVPTKAAPIAAPKAAAPKVEEKAQPTAAAAPKKTVTPKTEKPAPSATPARTDDLSRIEGIGPKIAELLTAAGLNTFADLAKAKPAAIKTILESAGPRYQMHDPATWPKQAALARDGKTTELEKLQADLKGGKKA